MRIGLNEWYGVLFPYNQSPFDEGYTPLSGQHGERILKR
jgi:hypothetical protein